MEDTWYDPVSVSTTLMQLYTSDIPIVSMSFHVDIPLGTGWMLASYDVLTASLAPSMLMFAAAGNDGEDVDDEVCIYDDWGCAESWWVSPCENLGVHCVGGIRSDSLGRAGGSNFGSGGNVQIFGPYQAWIGPSPDIAGIDVRLIAGTSISTPFVAGVAALVWAAKPSLSADEVWDQLTDTSLISGDPDVSQVVNAAAAVRGALGDLPPKVEITSPASGGSYIRSALYGNAGQVTVGASVVDPNEGADCCTVTWRTDEGETANGRSATLPLIALGTHVITLRAVDASGQASEDTITATLVESPPTAEILWPTADTTLIKGLTYTLNGRGVDAGYAIAGLPCEGLKWTIDGTEIGTGCTPTFTPGILGSRILVLRVFDPGDKLEATAQVAVTFAVPTAGTPPLVSILSPQPNARIDGEPLPNLRGAAIDPDGLPITAWKWTLVDRNGGQHTVAATQDANAVDLVSLSPCLDAECDYTLRLEATSTHGTGKAEIPLFAVSIH